MRPLDRSLHARSPLVMAILNGFFDVARLLLLEDDPNSSSDHVCCNWELSPLVVAAELGRVDVARLLLRAGTPPNLAESWPYRTPLVTAVLRNHADVVAELLAAGADARDAGSAKLSSGSERHIQIAGWTPLHMACRHGHAECARILIAAGAGIEARVEGYTPLLMAAEKGRTRAAEVLLSHGANVNAKHAIQKGCSAIFLACAHNHLTTVELLLNAGAAVDTPTLATTPLHVACHFGYVDIVRLLLTRVSVDAPDMYGRTGLHKAAMCGNVDMIVTLLEFGADPNMADKFGRTPVSVARDAHAHRDTDIHFNYHT